MSFFFLSTELYLSLFLCYLILHNSFNISKLVKINSSYKLTYIFLISLILGLFFEICEYYFNISNIVKFNSAVSGIKIFIIILFFLLLVFSKKYNEKNGLYNSDLLIIHLLSLLGLLLVISSNDIIIFFLAIELQSLAFYILASSKKYSIHSTESGLKYFILGSFSSGILLFGITSLYVFTGATSFSDLQLIIINNSLDFSNGLAISIIFLTTGFLFKIGSSPLHMWLPDVYEGAPLNITALFTIIPKIAIFIFFLRFYNTILIDYSSIWKSVLIISSILSMLIGSFGAIFQTKIKRMLAYSTISHTGFILLAFLTNTNDSYYMTLFYLVAYTIASLLIFTTLLNISINKNEIVYLYDMKGVGISHPFYATIISISLFSMAGIPPLLGFFAKYNVLSAAISSGYYISSIIGIITSVISAFYYIKIVRILFFETNKEIFFIDKMTRLNIILEFILLFSLSFLFLKLDSLYTIFYLFSQYLSL